ncbi:hypothetical protein HU675_0007700 [Bradyrhizobium septentrionale]|uniref:hypothetical protein n=1 Tax=Bradyrhizobium septentrionale TaxID=1404411 RepID=UPI0015964ED8|nr:hypothetical protein [Bradyrhizobium septentrionale]UGY26641.1 hypothetical protein HU675_0007700 [Bradyrhizobium septentrionale]
MTIPGEDVGQVGLIEKPREIIASNFGGKAVIVVSPGWERMKDAGEIATQIIEEEYAAERAKQLHPCIGQKGRFRELN